MTNLSKEEFLKQLELAEQGNPNAQYKVGLYYYNMALGAENYSELYDKAREWYYMSAKQGNIEAQHALGGCSLPGGDKERFYWVKKAADQGLPNACGSLGNFYLEGCGVEPNKRMAEHYFRKGAALGDDYCKETLLLDFDIPQMRITESNTNESDKSFAIACIIMILATLFTILTRR